MADPSPSPRPGPIAAPWRGPGPGRPQVPLPPNAMPLRAHGENRKRWRYVGYYGEELMLCLATAEIGPFRQCFWCAWDLPRGRYHQHTQLRPGRPEVELIGDRALLCTDDFEAELLLGASQPIESICPSGDRGGWGWTRKRAGVPVTGTVRLRGRRFEVDGLGMDDESAGYQGRRTDWLWTAGVGTSTDGRTVAWNLVEGINDPESGSERTIWVDGVPREPPPVSFQGLDAVRFRDGGMLSFTGGPERRRHDDFLLIKSDYTHRFGTFSGRLGDVELAAARGVMEEHRALW